jgi:aminoglycoside 6'-N-acetyltransferase
MHLRRAAPSDQVLLEHWDRQPHVIAAVGDDNGTLEWQAELPREVAWRELLIAEVEGRPVGFLQIIDPACEETHFWGDVGPGLRAIDIWIGETRDVGRRLGSQMMRQAIAFCFAAPDVTAVLIDPLASNARAIRFYVRLGFEPAGERVFERETCLVLRLERETWERQSRAAI